MAEPSGLLTGHMLTRYKPISCDAIPLLKPPRCSEYFNRTYSDSSTKSGFHFRRWCELDA
jgi:hypothetical protein